MSPSVGRSTLQIHFALKERDSGYSDIARRASKGARHVTPQNVRGVIYGYMKKNAGVIWQEVDAVLAQPANRTATRMAA